MNELQWACIRRPAHALSTRCCMCLRPDLGRLASGWPAGGGWRPCAASLAACRLALMYISWLHGRHSAQPQRHTRLETDIESMQGRFSCAAGMVHALRSILANMRGAHLTPAAFISESAGTWPRSAAAPRACRAAAHRRRSPASARCSHDTSQRTCCIHRHGAGGKMERAILLCISAGHWLVPRGTKIQASAQLRP